MKKAMGMFAALALAMAMTGVAYAHWSQIIYIEGTVETGEVTVGWLSADNDDDEYLGKDVGSVVVRLEGVKGTHETDNIYETLVIELNNVYPSYEAEITVEIANGGTIPVNLVDFDIYPVSDNDNLLDYLDWEITYVDWPDCPQIDPCETVEADIVIHIEQLRDPPWDNTICPQNATATFEGYLEFVQWNYDD